MHYPIKFFSFITISGKNYVQWDKMSPFYNTHTIQTVIKLRNAWKYTTHNRFRKCLHIYLYNKIKIEKKLKKI